jgi:hypothetical protein
MATAANSVRANIFLIDMLVSRLVSFMKTANPRIVPV